MKHRADGSNSVSDRLSDLSEPTRLRLLGLLERDELSVREVASIVQLPQSTVSRHLKLLTEGGWLLRRHVGTATYYRLINDELDPRARSLWVTVRDQLAKSAELAQDLQRLAAVLAERRTDSVAFFGRMAGEWDELRAGLFGRAFTADALLGLVPSEWAVADLGCGTGNASEQIAPYVSRVVAVDQSEEMLDAARLRLESFEHVEYRVGALESLPLEDASVDAAMCLLVLHHVETPQRAIAEMRRVLRTERGGGVALIVDMRRHNRTEFRESLGHRHLGFDTDALTRTVRDCGFDDVRVRCLPSDVEGKGPGLFVMIARITKDRNPASAGRREST